MQMTEPSTKRPAKNAEQTGRGIIQKKIFFFLREKFKKIKITAYLNNFCSFLFRFYVVSKSNNNTNIIETAEKSKQMENFGKLERDGRTST